ncbi:hypothetical protein [Evansella clarkii]|uniref:hypothetical protein n=1 Tax=Evansella clarkii TaxID=79879 RepID=UPI000997D745|nr:hypothetical protein [Evansella clarkii]
MNRYQVISLVVLIGLPLFFLLISIFTGKWGYFLFSIPPSLAAGLTGFFHAKKNGVRAPAKITRKG